MSKAVDHKSKTLAGVILLAFCVSAKARTDVTFWESPVNSKLNSIEVSEIVQDGSGAIWFATQEGLTRQRGEDVDIFTAANLEQGGLKPGRIVDLAVSSAGHLWVLTRSLQVFNPKTQSFDTPVTLSMNSNLMHWLLTPRTGSGWASRAQLPCIDLVSESLK